MNLRAWSALVLYVLGLAIAFGVQTWRHWRRTGSTGYRGLSGRPGSLPWWGGKLFALALVLALVAPLLTLTDVLQPWSLLSAKGVAIAGIALATFGLVVVCIAQLTMGASWRVGVDETERTALVTHGLFRWMRNPIFSGMVLVIIGQFLLIPTLVSAGAILSMVVAIQIQVRFVEEPYLIRLHERTYRTYAAKAGRFLPRLGRLK